MRKIKQLHQAVRDDIGSLVTYRAMPTHSIRHLDPFLFINHHGPQKFPPNNNGLPFGPHPHRGFETLTFILQGDITHRDSSTGGSVIKAGGIQLMTAGSGLVHSEESSKEFLKTGGMEEVIQLWLNLPSHLKMTEPKYVGLQKEEIPTIALDEGKVRYNLVTGEFNGVQGGTTSITGIEIGSIEFDKGGTFETTVASERNIFFYVVNGALEVNGTTVKARTFVEFANEGELLSVTAQTDSTLLFGHGEPFNERIVAHGPFVMNSEAEIRQAIIDYQMGKLGSL